MNPSTPRPTADSNSVAVNSELKLFAALLDAFFAGLNI